MRLFLLIALLLSPFVGRASPPAAGLLTGLRPNDFQDAVAAFERGDTPSAEAILNTILQKRPDDPAALDLLAAVLDTQKKFTEAETVYQHALRLTPNSATLLNNFANHQAATGNVKAARATYLKVVALDPTRANANLQLAAFAVEQKNGAEALRYLDHLQPSDQALPQVEILKMRALYLAGRSAEAAAILKRLSSQTDPRLSFTAGLALAAVARYADAEDCFTRSLQAAPANFDVLYNLGLAAFHAGHLERARDVLQTALAQRPQDVDTLYNLAVVDIDLKQREKALSLLVEAARLDPARPAIQLTIAQTASALGFYADSLLAYDKYLKLAPADRTAQRERDFMFAVSSHPREGLAALQEFLHAHPRDATAHYEVAVLEAQSDPSEAAAHFDQAVALQPDFAPARFGRGVLNYLQGNPAAALPDLEFAAARYPDNSQVLDRLGETYTALDRPSDALKALRKASTISPNDARVLMHLSRALSKAGLNDQARDTLARFRILGPQPGNLIPLPGYLDFLSLSPEQQQAQYREAVENRIAQNPQDAALNVRYLRLLIAEGKKEDADRVAARLLNLKPPAPLAAEAGRALLDAELYADAKPLLEYAANLSRLPATQLDLALACLYIVGPQEGFAQLDRIPEAERSGDYYLARAGMLDSAGNFPDALAALQHALTAAPTRAALYRQAAVFLARHGKAADAVSLLDRAARVLPDDPTILLLRAEITAAPAARE